MDELLGEDDRRFRDELREFVHANLDPVTRQKVRDGASLAKDDYVNWQRTLARQGWLTPTWPVADGGTGWSVVRQYLFEEELAAACCPQVGLTLAVGPRLAGPILCRFGTEAQKRRFLPGIRDASVWWCQGYSENGAGSDLASLRTTAVLDGEDYVVNGEKTWTSYAHWADLMCCLVRTQPQAQAQQGISFLVLDMASPGVHVRALPGANGRHFFNEVRLENVRVPAANLIGPEHGGWGLAKALLEHERLNAARLAETRLKVDWAARLIAARCDAGRPGLEDAGFLQRLADLESDHRALEALVLRFVARAGQGEPVGPAASVLKVRGTELLQAAMDLLSDLLGPQVHDNAARNHWANAFYTRGFTIAAGTSEVQRNVIARQVLGMNS